MQVKAVLLMYTHMVGYTTEFSGVSFFVSMHRLKLLVITMINGRLIHCSSGTGTARENRM